MKVNTSELVRQAEAMKIAATRVKSLQDSLQQIHGRLGQYTIGEKFQKPLSTAIESVANRVDELATMQMALQQIAELYEATEARITDETENATVHNGGWSVSTIPIPSLITLYDSEVQQDFPIMTDNRGPFGNSTYFIDWIPWEP